MSNLDVFVLGLVKFFPVISKCQYVFLSDIFRKPSTMTNDSVNETTNDADVRQNVPSIESGKQGRENDESKNSVVCPFESVIPLHCVCAIVGLCCGCNVATPITPECMLYAERYCEHSDYFSHVCPGCDYIQRFVK